MPKKEIETYLQTSLCDLVIHESNGIAYKHALGILDSKFKEQRIEKKSYAENDIGLLIITNPIENSEYKNER